MAFSRAIGIGRQHREGSAFPLEFALEGFQVFHAAKHRRTHVRITTVPSPRRVNLVHDTATLRDFKETRHVETQRKVIPVKKRYALAALAATSVFPLATLAPANAAPPARNEATVISHVTIDKNDPSVGYVRARYTCQPEHQASIHLWVSVKQDQQATANPLLLQEGSASNPITTTWVQSHPSDEVTCDGKNHVQVFEVNTLEQAPPEFGGGTVGHGQLVRGTGYVQFCLLTEDTGLFVADMNFQKVK